VIKRIICFEDTFIYHQQSAIYSGPQSVDFRGFSSGFFCGFRGGFAEFVACFLDFGFYFWVGGECWAEVVLGFLEYEVSVCWKEVVQVYDQLGLDASYCAEDCLGFGCFSFFVVSVDVASVKPVRPCGVCSE